MEVIPAGAEHDQSLKTSMCHLRTRSAIKHVHMITGSLASFLYQPSPSFSATFKTFARTCFHLYHMRPQKHHRNLIFSERMSPNRSKNRRGDSVPLVWDGETRFRRRKVILLTGR